MNRRLLLPVLLSLTAFAPALCADDNAEGRKSEPTDPAAPPPPPPAIAEPPPASAPPPIVAAPPMPDIGILTALRIARASPHGKLADSDEGTFSENVTSQTVVAFDVGLRWQRWVFGLYIGLGFGSVADRQKELLSATGWEGTSVFSATVGPEVHYYFVDSGAVRPWVGALTGYEGLGISAKSGSLRQTLSFNAWQLLRPMFGVDFKLTRGFGLGLFTDVSLARFTSYKQSVTDETQKNLDGTDKTVSEKDVEITNPAFHMWWTIGARMTLGSAW